MNTANNLVSRERTVCLNVKSVRTIMTRRSKWLCAESDTSLIVSSARSTRWRLFARTATAVSLATAWKRTEKSSAVSTVHARPAQHNSRTALERRARHAVRAVLLTNRPVNPKFASLRLCPTDHAAGNTPARVAGWLRLQIVWFRVHHDRATDR